MLFDEECDLSVESLMHVINARISPIKYMEPWDVLTRLININFIPFMQNTNCFLLVGYEQAFNYYLL